MTWAWIVGIIIVLLIDYFVAQEFEAIAVLKGYYGKPYFWWTFFLGIVGMLMVIALPNIKNDDSSAN